MFKFTFKKISFCYAIVNNLKCILSLILVPSLPLITTLFLCSPLACKGEFDVSSTRTILLMGDLLYEMRLHEFFLEYFAHWICWARILFIHLFSQDWYWNGLDYINIYTYITIFLSAKVYTYYFKIWLTLIL